MHIQERNAQQLQFFMENIANIRAYYGISKKRMANLLGIGLWRLNRMERGGLSPIPVGKCADYGKSAVFCYPPCSAFQCDCPI